MLTLQKPDSKGTIEDVLRPGNEMVAAGYTMCEAHFITLMNTLSELFIFRYGSSANLVLSTGSGVNGYTLDAALGEFILTHPDVCSPVLYLLLSFVNSNSNFNPDQDSFTRENLLVQ